MRACDRPAQLERLLASISEYERRHRAGRHYVVLDDSVLAVNIDRHRDLLREFARTLGCKVTYVGPAERQRLVERLGKAVPNHQAALQQMLLPQAGATRFGGGRSWNLALLLSAGNRFVMFDDDQCLPLRRHERARDGLDLNPTQLPFARFYRNMEEALAAGDELGDDPFNLHLDVCGIGLGELIGRSEYSLNRESLRGLNLARLAHLNSDTRVLATQQGTYGSARSESAAWIYHLDAGRPRGSVRRPRCLSQQHRGAVHLAGHAACPPGFDFLVHTVLLRQQPAAALHERAGSRRRCAVLRGGAFLSSGRAGA